MSIRVSGGYLKGRILKTLPGRETRPTTSRVREAIFSIIQHEIVGARIVDIFAGSGALAIEAISRGAASAVLIEKNKKAAAVIAENIKKLEVDARLIVSDYQKGLARLASEKISMDIFFADPPYTLITPDILADEIEKYSLVKSGSLLILEHAGTIVPKDKRMIKTRRFGDSTVSIFRYE